MENEQMVIYEYDGQSEALPKKNEPEVKIVYKTAALAFETFNNKLFSRQIEDHKVSENTHVVDPEKSHTGTNSSIKFESPQERIARIGQEIKTLSKQLDSLSQGDPIKQITSGAVAKDIDNMEMDFGAILNDIRISPYLINDAPFSKSTLNRPDSEIAAGLINQVGNLSGKGQSGISYELFHRTRAGDKELRLNAVERRVDALEKRVGTVGKKTGFNNMHAALGDLYKKLDLLQGSNIDSLTRKIASMNSELELQKHLLRIKGAKGGEKKINELAEIFQKGSKTTKELPEIIKGLQAQDERHKAQTDAVLRLQKLQRSQQALSSILTQDQEVLEKVAENMAENMKLLKGNIENFKKRFSVLNSKLDQL